MENRRLLVWKFERNRPTNMPSMGKQPVDIPAAVIDRAFAVYEEFGPDRRIDRRERLKAVLHLGAPEEVERVMEYMKSISDTVWQLAEKGGEIKMGKARIREALRAEHPYLTDIGLRKATFLVNYFAWHEGFDK
jgi:hypothetical protein